MDKLNQKMLEAIKENSDAELKASEENSNALQLIIRSFKGTFKLTFAVVLIIQLTCAGFAIFFGYHMLNETEMLAKIDWLAGCILAVLAFAIARLFFFMELNRLSLIREVKRVELQLSVIAKAIDDKA